MKLSITTIFIETLTSFSFYVILAKTLGWESYFQNKWFQNDYRANRAYHMLSSHIVLCKVMIIVNYMKRKTAYFKLEGVINGEIF